MNLRCRKALSTRNNGWAETRGTGVNESEMPKGVEHLLGLSSITANWPRVNESEMPKGVEHDLQGVRVSHLVEVNESEMPKGVEH